MMLDSLPYVDGGMADEEQQMVQYLIQEEMRKMPGTTDYLAHLPPPPQMEFPVCFFSSLFFFLSSFLHFFFFSHLYSQEQPCSCQRVSKNQIWDEDGPNGHIKIQPHPPYS